MDLLIALKVLPCWIGSTYRVSHNLTSSACSHSRQITTRWIDQFEIHITQPSALVGNQNASKLSTSIGLHVSASSLIVLSIVLVPLWTKGGTKLPQLVILFNTAVVLFKAAYLSACMELKGITPEDIEFLENGVCIGFIFFPWDDIDVQSSDWVHPGVVIQKRVKSGKANPNPFVVKVSPQLLDEVLKIAKQLQPQPVVVE